MNSKYDLQHNLDNITKFKTYYNALRQIQYTHFGITYNTELEYIHHDWKMATIHCISNKKDDGIKDY